MRGEPSVSTESDFLQVLDRIAVAWERIAYATEESLGISKEGIALQLQMAKSSAALEGALSRAQDSHPF
jgi:hypothetical protein